MRLGRLTDETGLDFELAHREANYRLRHYVDPTAAASERSPILLVPPLMLTAEVYDLAPDLSAVGFLTRRGLDAWVVDFGAPEREERGMSRTLDDHVRGVADAVQRVHDATGRDVHLVGYSQGGMFCYQAAALLRSAHVASVITFGSPVDIHRSLPKVSTDVTARLIRALRPIAEPALSSIEGLPGFITSTGFKLLSPKKELEQLVDFVGKLHDRQALEKREVRRRFLGGEGFVAWPGPALLKFVDEFIVHNRMMSGGFVIDGRTVTLADIQCPILYFVGGRDEIARPAAVRAIRRAVPHAESHEAVVPAGHFGLVVGSTAMRESWPGVVEWVNWREGAGARPRLLGGESIATPVDAVEVEDAAFDEPLEFDLFTDAVRGTAESLWRALGNRFEDLGDTLDALRYQVPRLHKLGRIDAGVRVSFAQALQQQAERIPDQTFFLWKGRAFTYGDANRRVDAVTRGLIASGVRRGHRVAVLMAGRPSFLSIVTALNRLGAIAVLLSPDLDDDALKAGLAAGDADFVAADPELSARASAASDQPVLVLGGGGPNRAVPPGVTDLEKIDPDAVELPVWYAPNPGLAEDLSLVFVTAGQGMPPRAARVTNRRWAISAYGAAAACTLTKDDTVYCCRPLHHPSGLLVSVGSALVAGSRLALATRFEAATFWREVRRYGATVSHYAGEMCRELVEAPPSPDELHTPLRLLAGSGMRKHLWRQVVDRFGVGVLEFYAATESNLVLANASGEKLGALGSPLPGSAEPALARYSFERNDFVRDASGTVLRASLDEPGLLLARATTGSAIDAADEPARVLQDVFEKGDRWFVTGDLLRRDADGDFWFVDRLSSVIRTADRVVFARQIEDSLYTIDGVSVASVFGLDADDGQTVIAAVVLDRGTDVDAFARTVVDRLDRWARPARITLLDGVPLTGGCRPIVPLLKVAARRPSTGDLELSEDRTRYHVRGARGAARVVH